MRAKRERPSTRTEVGAVARASLAAGLLALGGSCFDGADALGLPCLSDGDCGQGQRCEQGFCGGPPATSTASGSSSSGSSSDGGSSSSSGPDPTVAESTGPQPGCGNGLVEPELGEDCEPASGMDEAACNMDCTVAACGDGYVNAAAGEECDDQNMEIVDDCTPQCRATVFWDDMALDPMLGSQWLMPEIPEYEYMGAPFSVAAGWQWGSAEPGTWWSGPYSDSSGTARLITRPIEFPEPGRGFRYELRLRHRLRFDGNVDDVGGCGESTSDGGVVWIMDMPMGMLRPAGPPMGAGQAVLENAGECSLALMMPDNPLFDPAMPRPAYSGITAFVDTGFPLPLDVAGTTVQLVFEISYDCANCWSAGVPLDAGWTIDHVVVAAFPV